MRTFTLVLTIAFLFTTAANAQYCMLTGRTSYSSLQPGITNFKLGKIDRTSSNVENPLSQPSLVVTTDSVKLERGKTYKITITHTRDSVIFPAARNNIRVWLDYNSDKDFTDAGETIISKDFITAGVFTDSFTVPKNAPLGTTRLRATAKMSSDAGHSIPTPCDDPKDPIDYHGEMEDYTVTIVDSGANIHEFATNMNEINIYPNPTTGQVTVAFNNSLTTAVSISMYDVTGKLVAELLKEGKSSSSSYTFDINRYAPAAGVYYLKISSGDVMTFEKIIKSN